VCLQAEKQKFARGMERFCFGMLRFNISPHEGVSHSRISLWSSFERNQNLDKSTSKQCRLGLHILTMFIIGRDNLMLYNTLCIPTCLQAMLIHAMAGLWNVI
jgi:hypothetical protein